MYFYNKGLGDLIKDIGSDTEVLLIESTTGCEFYTTFFKISEAQSEINKALNIIGLVQVKEILSWLGCPKEEMDKCEPELLDSGWNNYCFNYIEDYAWVDFYIRLGSGVNGQGFILEYDQFPCQLCEDCDFCCNNFGMGDPEYFYDGPTEECQYRKMLKEDNESFPWDEYDKP